MTSSVTRTTVRPRCHVAICPFPFSSHLASMLLLTRKMAASVPTDVQISFFTTERSAKAISPEDVKSENIRVHMVDDGLSGAESVHPLEEIRRFSEAAGESLRTAMEAADEEVGVKITCLVADAMMAFVCSEIAEERGIKWAALWTPSATGLVAHMYTDQLREAVAAEGFEAHKEDLVNKYIQGFPPGIRLRDLPNEILRQDYSFPVARILHTMSLLLPKAIVVVVNSFETLEPASTCILKTIFNDKLLSAGPYALTMSFPQGRENTHDPQDCLTWLDSHADKPASVVYISFGVTYTPPPEEFTSLAEALEATKVPFLWSLPDKFKSYLPQGFEKSGVGKVVSWAPQTLVLGHVAIGAHLTHCGWNSVMESVVSAVPLICRPIELVDNLQNGRMVAESGWGIGVEVEGGRMTKAATTVALEKVMFGEEGRKAREKINSIKRLAEEATIEPDGSSTQNLRKFITIITS